MHKIAVRCIPSPAKEEADMRVAVFLIFTLLLSLVQPLAAGEKPEAAGVKYQVVINHEEQYSIWVVEGKLPKGWKPTGFIGSKESALDHIEEVWTDMRPLSSRRELALKIYQQQKSKN
jgi:MbtH protein